jgi:Tfp pilus assembly protein PilN
MINLLPPDVQQNIGYSRRNTRLMRWVLALSSSIVGTAVVVTFGLFYINQSTTSYSNQVDKTNAELIAQKLPETQKQVEDISGSLNLVVQVLSREVLFSKLLKQIGAAIPANASLTGLSISKVTGGIDLSAVTTDYGTATQVQVNLQDPNNKIFDKADILNITCAASNATDTHYPCTVTIRAQFAANNPFLFINTTPVAAPKS